MYLALICDLSMYASMQCICVSMYRCTYVCMSIHMYVHIGRWWSDMDIVKTSCVYTYIYYRYYTPNMYTHSMYILDQNGRTSALRTWRLFFLVSLAVWGREAGLKHRIAIWDLLQISLRSILGQAPVGVPAHGCARKKIADWCILHWWQRIQIWSCPSLVAYTNVYT